MTERDGRENTDADADADWSNESDIAAVGSDNVGSCKIVHSSAKNSMGERRVFMLMLVYVNC